MVQVIIIVFMIIVIGYALIAGISRTQSGLTLETSDDTIPVIEEPITFDEIGTLVFYPNNAGRPVPYLFYDDDGHTVAKALVFPNSAPIEFSSWTGARVLVAGTVKKEHVVVDRITYVSPP